MRPAAGEVVRKVKHSSVRIKNLFLTLYSGTGYFSLARTFRTVWGGFAAVGMVCGEIMTSPGFGRNR